MKKKSRKKNVPPKENAALSEAAVSDAAPSQCLNCDAPLFGDFCYRCGQKSDVRPFTFKILFKQLWESFRKFDAEVKTTFVALLVRPGEFCREYLAGKRKPYTEPLKYFFLSFAVYVLIFGFIRYFSPNPEIDAAAKIDTKMQLMVLSSVFFWALGYKLIFPRTGHNLAENMVCLLFLVSESRVFSAVVQLLFLPFTTILEHETLIQGGVNLAITFVYFTYFCRGFYQEPWLAAALKNIVVILIFLVLFVPVLFLEIIADSLIETLLK